MPGAQHDAADRDPQAKSFACQVTDTVAVTSRSMTKEGYLVVKATLCRTGVQEYAARELGLDKALGMDANQRVRLLRPREEVFNPASMSTFENKPVTNDHPPPSGDKRGTVHAGNWRKYSVGDSGTCYPDGDHVGSSLVIRDQSAIDDVQQDGKVEISNGYTFELEMTPGKTAAGLVYDGIQRNIVGNHIAIVDRARGGRGCRIADNDTTNKDKPMKIIVVDGVSLEFENATAASLVERVVADAKSARTKAEGDLATAQAAVKTANDKITALEAANVKTAEDHAKEITALKAKIPTDAQIEALAADRAATVMDALVLVPKFEAKGKTLAAIRVECLTPILSAADADKGLKAIAEGVLAGVALDKADEAVVAGAFRAVAAARKATTTTTDAEGERQTAMDRATGRALAGGGNGAGGTTNADDGEEIETLDDESYSRRLVTFNPQAPSPGDRQSAQE